MKLITKLNLTEIEENPKLIETFESKRIEDLIICSSELRNCFSVNWFFMYIETHPNLRAIVFENCIIMDKIILQRLFVLLLDCFHIKTLGFSYITNLDKHIPIFVDFLNHPNCLLECLSVNPTKKFSCSFFNQVTNTNIKRLVLKNVENIGKLPENLQTLYFYSCVFKDVQSLMRILNDLKILKSMFLSNVQLRNDHIKNNKELYDKFHSLNYISMKNSLNSLNINEFITYDSHLSNLKFLELKTLHRAEQIQLNKIKEFIKNHPKLRSVEFSGQSFPQVDIKFWNNFICKTNILTVLCSSRCCSRLNVSNHISVLPLEIIRRLSQFI